MIETHTITLTDAPNAADAKLVHDGLDAYNCTHVEPEGYRPLALFVRDSENHILGGLLGCTYWGWLYVEVLWLDEAVRRQGYGGRLLDMAEREALGRGCHHVHLDTMDFQALPFYLAQGYEEWGRLQDLPLGHTRHFLRKKLETGGPG